MKLFVSIGILIVLVISAAPIGRAIFPQQPTVAGLAIVVLYVVLVTWLGLRSRGNKRGADGDP